jgi:hypothetical protein
MFFSYGLKYQFREKFKSPILSGHSGFYGYRPAAGNDVRRKAGSLKKVVFTLLKKVKFSYYNFRRRNGRFDKITLR